MEQLGRYTLLEELGSGGFATVYKAEMTGPEGFKSVVAIKRIHPYLTHNDPGFVQSLTNEARICAMIQHPNVVHVHELAHEPDEEGREQFYMVMELVTGVTLDVLLRMADKRDGRLPRAVVIDILLQVARGLAHVHGLTDGSGRPMGMVHRDLKPGNVLVSQEGQAKILDFGIAKAINMAGPRTATGVTRGTAAYMSPEQAYGQKVSFASDLFSFGAILFEAAVGKQLIVGDSMAAQLMTVVNTPPTFRADELAEAFPELEAVFVKLRQPDPRQRYESTEELVADLRRIRRELDDDTDPEAYLRDLMRDPDARVSPREVAQFKVMRSDLRAPSTATFFELPGYRRDRDGKLVPADQAARSWGVEIRPSGDHVETTPRGRSSSQRQTVPMPSLHQRRVPVFWIAAVVVMLLVSGFLVAKIYRLDREPENPTETVLIEPGEATRLDRLDEIVIETAGDDGAGDGEGAEADTTSPAGDGQDREGVAEEPVTAAPVREDAAAVDDAVDDAEEEGVGAVEPPTPEEPVVTRGTLKINAYPAATVYIDGVSAGSTFVTARGVQVEAGTHHLRLVRNSDGVEATLTVEVTAGEVEVVPFQWEP